MAAVKKLGTWLATAFCYHHILHLGLWVFLSGVAARAATFWFDRRRRIPQACAIFFWGTVQFLTNPFWRIEVTGKEHLAGGGPYLVCCNHQSLVDSLAMLMIGHQVKFISHRKVFKAPLLGTMMRLCGYVSVDPRNPFPAAGVAREIEGWWSLGESVCLYPEGTRSTDGRLQPFKVGGFRLARNRRVPVLPVAIDGTADILPKGRLSGRGRIVHRIRVRILPPITAEEYGDDALELCRRTHRAIGDALDGLRAPAEPRSLIVIGAGIAGMAAGCYGQMNGYRTRIFELHDQPGGLCTAWKRGGYSFDGCVQQVLGSRPGRNPAWYQVWEELGAVQGRRMIHHDESMRVEDGNGGVVCFYEDIDRLRAHLLELSPADGAVIGELCDAVRKLAGCAPPILVYRDLMGPLQGLDALRRFLPYLRLLHRYTGMSVEEFVRRFEDPSLRRAFTILFDLPDFPMLTALFSLAFHHNKMAGFPEGGSLEFSRAIERRYRDLGGEVQYRARVEQILVEDGRAVGVRLADGSEHRADVVISAADGRSTVFDLLGGRHVGPQIREYYDSWPTFPSLVQVSLGVDRDFSGEPPRVAFPIADPIDIAGEPHDVICLKHLSYDPTAAPPGKSSIRMMFASPYEPWAALAEDREAYRAEKRRVADQVIDRLDARYPGLRDQVEAVDVTTPLTYERYTANWNGSMEGWLVTTDVMRRLVRGKGMSKTLPGLDGFYMAGQWVEPGGGVPAAALSGRNVIQLVCHGDRRPFQTSVP